LRQLNGEKSIESDELVRESITDFRSYQTLYAIGLAMSANSRRLHLSAMTMARGFRVWTYDEPETPGADISGRPFSIEVRKAASEKAAGQKP
jgi:hypothetical protein